MTDFIALVEKINNLVWAYVLPVGFLGLGIMLTIQLRAFPQRHIQHSIKYLVASTKRSPEPGSLSPLSTLALALSATIGIGNIIGVLAAIQFGGPGAYLDVGCWYSWYDLKIFRNHPVSQIQNPHERRLLLWWSHVLFA